MSETASGIAVVHADESCLGNRSDTASPGGAASLIEIRIKSVVTRHDLYISSPASTNNRMALNGAVATFALLSRKGRRLRVLYVSDSEYLVKGIREWVPGWERRGWKRKGGELVNAELWQALAQVTRAHDATWQWVRGHAGHPKNEYANELAIRSAREQLMSAGAVPSEFESWLAGEQARGKFPGYDPDADFTQLEARLTNRG